MFKCPSSSAVPASIYRGTARQHSARLATQLDDSTKLSAARWIPLQPSPPAGHQIGERPAQHGK